MQLFEAVFKIFGTAFLEVVEIKVRFDQTYFHLKRTSKMALPNILKTVANQRISHND